MANASHDNNRVPTMLGMLDSDGSTPIKIKANASTNSIMTMDGITGSDNSDDNAIRDENRVVGMLGVSNADGVTPVPLYVDTNGNLLTDCS